MASKKFSDSVPPLPASLKSISSFVQRADELRTKDPVMAYWLTYYAAQLGLDLKSHEAGARDYLFALITYLEEMKKELEGNDAVENEAAGAAYVENFALKVFALADNEDRKGEASRSTAKKFLAAANFLELLKVFEKSNNAEVNEEKVRYAKWKASDIAKAFREGRKPTPGAAGNGTDDIDNLPRFNSAVAETPTARTPADRSPVGSSPPVLSSDVKSLNIPKRTPPSTSIHLPGPIDVPPTEVSSSGTWSTVATPGSEAVGPSSTATRLAFASAMNRWRDNNSNDAAPMVFPPGRAAIPDDSNRGTATIDATTKKVHFTPSVVGGLSSTNGSPPPSPEPRKTAPLNSTSSGKYVSSTQSRAEMGTGSSFSGRPDPTMAPLPDSSPSGSSRTSLDGSPLSNSNSVPGRLRSGSSPPINSVLKPGSSPPGAVGARRNSPPRSRRLSLQSSVPPAPALPTYSGGHGRRSSVSGRPSPPGSGNPQPYPSNPPPQSPNSSSFASTSTFASPNPYGFGGTSGPQYRAPMTGLPPVASDQATPSSYLPNYAPKPPSPPSRHPVPTFEAPAPVELTPALIAKAQKHCRYAISALEYEDPEQARKELHAALAVLGER